MVEAYERSAWPYLNTPNDEHESVPMWNYWLDKKGVSGVLEQVRGDPRVKGNERLQQAIARYYVAATTAVMARRIAVIVAFLYLLVTAYGQLIGRASAQQVFFNEIGGADGLRLGKIECTRQIPNFGANSTQDHTKASRLYIGVEGGFVGDAPYQGNRGDVGSMVYAVGLHLGGPERYGYNGVDRNNNEGGSGQTVFPFAPVALCLVPAGVLLFFGFPERGLQGFLMIVGGLVLIGAATFLSLHFFSTALSLGAVAHQDNYCYH